MTRLKSIPLLLLLGISVVAYADVIRDGSLNAKSTPTGVYVWWYSSDESGVRTFEIQRNSGTGGQWIPIAEVTPKGSGSYYDFNDETAFKLTDNFYQYRINIIFTDPNRPSVATPSIGVVHNTSSVRRTWGSIKAMFR